MSGAENDPSPAVRRMEPADVPFCLAQTAREGWTTTADDFAVHLAHDPEGCFVATVRGRPAAMVTTTGYRATGWIGNLIVAPEHRGRQLGSTLMERAITCLESRGLRTLCLEADPLGISIYRRLGFAEAYDSPRFRNDAPGAVDPGEAAPLARADLAELASFDSARFGDERGRLLGLLLERAHAAFRVPRRGAIAGYLMMLRGVHGLRIGPWVADHDDAARALLRAALAAADGTAVTLAVPGPNTAACEVVRAAGFRETPSSLRMVRGPRAGEGVPGAVFALANGAVG